MRSGASGRGEGIRWRAQTNGGWCRHQPPLVPDGRPAGSRAATLGGRVRFEASLVPFPWVPSRPRGPGRFPGSDSGRGKPRPVSTADPRPKPEGRPLGRRRTEVRRFPAEIPSRRFPTAFRRCSAFARGASALPGWFSEIPPRIRLRLCWRGFFHRPAGASRPISLGERSRSSPAFGLSGRRAVSGPPPFRPRREAVTGSRFAPAQSACG